LTWETLEQDGKGVSIPPHAGGLVRLKWKGDKPGDQLFWANLWVDEGAKTEYERFQVFIHFVEAIRIAPEGAPGKAQTYIGRLYTGEERTARFLCTSDTRAKFTLTPAPPKEHPCFTYGTPEPLSKEELKSLSDASGKPILAGYRVTVTVHEHVGKTHLDMGPFRRKVAWKTDLAPDHEISSHIDGVVRGEVRLVTAEGEPYLDLGTFSANPLDFVLEGDEPQLQLTWDEAQTLDFLKVELLDGKDGQPAGSGKSWRVRAVFKTDSIFRGRFPDPDRPGYDNEACVIAFLVSRPGQETKSARRLFIPVRGNVPTRN
jgi:hypothetical protein